MPNEFTISAQPSFRAASPGAKLTFVLNETPGGPKVTEVTARWMIINDPKTVGLFDPSMVLGPNGPRFADVPVNFPGLHRVVCDVTHKGKTTSYTYEQWVVPNVDLVDGPILPVAGGHPDSVLDGVRREVQLLETMAKVSPPPADKKDTFDKFMEQRRDFMDKLGERMKSTRGFVRHAIRAEYVDAETQKRVPLRLFLSKVASDKWLLVDWTQPQVRSATGEYEGNDKDPNKAIREAFEDWDEDNRYPAGAITFSVEPFRTDRDSINAFKGEFETDGTAFWDSVSSFFGWIGLGAAVVAGVVTLVAPLPGSQLVSGLIWTSILSSTAAAAVNIGARLDEGFSSWQANAFDILTIVGNIFGATGFLWSRGANVLLNRGGKVVQFALIGSITTDGLQGILLAKEVVEQFDAIQADKNLTPEQRLSRLQALFTRALSSGTLLYFSVRGTKADLDNLNLAAQSGGKTPKQILEDLKDPAKTVDLSKPPKVEGDASKGPHTTRVNTDQEMQPPEIRTKAPAQVVKPKKKFKGPQNTDNLDELFKQAEVAQTELAQFTRDVCAQFGAKPDIPPTVKARKRTEEKIEADYGGDASQIQDLARSTMIFNTLQDLRNGFEIVKSKLQVIRTKDNFANPINGYRDMKINARMSNGHVVEIQLQLARLKKVKEEVGDKLYQRMREIEAIKKKRPLKPEEATELRDLSKQQQDLFDAAFRESGGK